MTITLGRLETISVREAWGNEATNFTPWLAVEENLTLLAESLGMELELTALEQSVGAFYADILCKDTATGQTVLIENQLEKTDHNHLGQIITYAAGLDARTVVWISTKMREEHRAAIDWLNENTIDTLQFFGVEVELWRISDSPLAPKFNLVAKPNDWTKSVAQAAHSLESAPLSETKIQQQKYWATLSEYIANQNLSIRSQKAFPQHWTNFSIGRSGLSLAATVNSVKNRIGVELFLSGAQAKEHFQKLETNKEETEKGIGSILEWQELPESKGSRIVLYKENVDPTNENEWPAQHEWIARQLEAFNRVFRPKVRELP